VKRLLAIVFGDPFELPPTLHVASALARRGWQVEVLGVRFRGHPDLEFSVAAPVRRVLTVPENAASWAAYGAFAAAVSARALSFRPRLVYAFDPMAAPLGRLAARVARAEWIYHCHDSARSETLSRGQRLFRLIERERAAARSAALVVFPQAERARRFADEAELREPPMIVPNCPPADWLESAPPAPPAIAEACRRFDRLAVYQGGLSRDLGIGALIDSLPHWRAGDGLLLVGNNETSEARALADRARALGVADRMVWSGALPHRALPSVTRMARAGLLVTAGENFNLVHLAGASNKIFEYLACGLAVLAPRTPGFAELIERPGHGELCDDASPRALAAQIARLLDDDPARVEMRRRNAAAFRERWHYEAQFAPVAARLESAA
jgi:glycosyltransferase involved in cell wall biosynthesis